MLKSQANNYFENNLLDNVILNEIHLLYVLKILLIIKMFQMPRIILYLQGYNTNQGLQNSTNILTYYDSVALVHH